MFNLTENCFTGAYRVTASTLGDFCYKPPKRKRFSTYLADKSMLKQEANLILKALGNLLR